MSRFSEQRDQLTAKPAGPSWRWMVLAVGLLLLAWISYALFQFRRSAHLSLFAQCLRTKNIKMYGAWWCPHCAEQKQELGHGFESVDYVECSLPGVRTATQQCKQAQIQHFPTWEFADGSRMEGVLSLEELSKKSGCRWP